MSIELPEAHILSMQMNRELTGKQIAACKLQNTQKMQKIGFLNMYLSDYNELVGCKVEKAVSRGNTIRLKLSQNQNLIITPEYGGITLFHPKTADAPAKYTIKVEFTDGSAFSARLTSMGVIKAAKDSQLSDSFVYSRDFSTTPSPMEPDFTAEAFQTELARRNVNLKTVLVGKDAAVVGLSNAAFQDILYQAGIHPKHKASELTAEQQHALYNAIKAVVNQRIELGGKEQFVDFYGKKGSYVAAMGSNLNGKSCPTCGTLIVKMSLGGGQVHVCPNCQK